MSESAGGGVARLNRGGSPESRGDDEEAEDEDEEDEDFEEELPGLISAFGVPSSELETARRNRGGALSPPPLVELLGELLEELFEELFDELPDESSELELARRSLGRSGSLSLDELEELPALSSELDAARRSVGLLGFEEPEELLAEFPLELFEEDEDELSDDRGSGLVSSVCSDASECSSVVPSRTIVIETAL